MNLIKNQTFCLTITELFRKLLRLVLAVLRTAGSPRALWQVNKGIDVKQAQIAHLAGKRTKSNRI
jgi:hypothetical protein